MYKFTWPYLGMHFLTGVLFCLIKKQVLYICHEMYTTHTETPQSTSFQNSLAVDYDSHTLKHVFWHACILINWAHTTLFLYRAYLPYILVHY